MNAELEIMPYIMMHIYHCVSCMRRYNDYQYTYIAILYTLYGYHKQYQLSNNNEDILYVASDNDILLHDLKQLLKTQKYEDITGYLKELHSNLTQYDIETYETCYFRILYGLTNMFASSMGKNGGEFFTPTYINTLIAHFINTSGCKTVFDPYCGTSSIVHLLADGIQFEGQEVDEVTSLIARVNQEAKYGTDNGITWISSTAYWNNATFDAVISCPPFGVIVPQTPLKPNDNLVYPGERNYLEYLLLKNAIEINKANLVISLEPTSLCYSHSYEEIRHFIIDNNYLDTVIYLPQNLLFGTSVNCVLIICKNDRKKNDPIRLVNAESLFKGDNISDRSLDYDSIIKAIDSNDQSIIVYANRNDVIVNKYNLNIALYDYNTIALAEGQQRILLNNLIEKAVSEEYHPTEDINIFSYDILSTDLISILLGNKTKSVEKSRTLPPTQIKKYRVNGGESFILYQDSPTSTRYAIYSRNEDFACVRGIKVLRVNKNLVTPEYLVYSLLNNPVLKKGYGLLSNYFMLHMVIDTLEEQRRIIDRIKREYADNQRRETEAEVERLGIKQNVSDLEHMLGTPQHKIERIINKLERITPDNPCYPKTVKQLKDCFDYMGRIIHFSNASIKSFKIEKHNITTFINDYIDSWNNYEGNYFELSIQNNLFPDSIVSFDDTLLTVMLDAILNNAGKHSFHKNRSYNEEGNRVEISIDEAIYQGNSYVLLRVANNGDPLPDGYTIKDYITKGNYAAETGHTGLGGYHVYQITKGHNGFMYIDTNKIWNFIIDILLPIDRITTQDIMYYERECI